MNLIICWTIERGNSRFPTARVVWWSQRRRFQKRRKSITTTSLRSVRWRSKKAKVLKKRTNLELSRSDASGFLWVNSVEPLSQILHCLQAWKYSAKRYDTFAKLRSAPLLELYSQFIIFFEIQIFQIYFNNCRLITCLILFFKIYFNYFNL